MAVNSRDPDRLRATAGEGFEVITGRSSHQGPEAVAAWVGKEYDHLLRRYAIADYREIGDAVLAVGAVEYVWAEGGEVADVSPIAIGVEFEAGRPRRMRLHDDPLAALAALEG